MSFVTIWGLILLIGLVYAGLVLLAIYVLGVIWGSVLIGVLMTGINLAIITRASR